MNDGVIGTSTEQSYRIADIKYLCMGAKIGEVVHGELFITSKGASTFQHLRTITQARRVGISFVYRSYHPELRDKKNYLQIYINQEGVIYKVLFVDKTGYAWKAKQIKI